MPTSTQLTQEGIAALKAGDKARAYDLLSRALAIDSANQQAWLWLSGAVTDYAERRGCLEQAVAIDPNSDAGQRAARGLLLLPPEQPAIVVEPPPAAAPQEELSEPEPAESAPPPPATGITTPLEAMPPEAPKPAKPATDWVMRGLVALAVLAGILLVVSIVFRFLIAVPGPAPSGPTSAQGGSRPAQDSPPRSAQSTSAPAQATAAPLATAIPMATATASPTVTPIAEAAPVTLLAFPVVDAEYSPALDRIIMVSDQPNQLHIIDPVTREDATVDLAYVPTSVSVGPDGMFAAVGHDAKISYIDLQERSVVKTLDITLPVFDIVLAGNGWVYASSAKEEGLRAVDITSNAEVSVMQYYQGGAHRLHPDGKSIYWADRGVSPDDILKTDISKNTLGETYDSPYHGDYAICGNLWLSDDGYRIFTACGAVFKTSSNRDNDMTYNGSLKDAEYIQSLAVAASVNKILVLTGSMPGAAYFEKPSEDQLILYDYETLQKRETVPLPGFLVNNTHYPGHSRFVFVNSSGTQYYLILQADESSGLLNDFGIVAADLDLPEQSPTPGATATTAEPVVEGSIIPLGASIIDAEYSLSLDRIVMISDNPPQLHIYDPATKSDVPVELSYAPTSVSVSPDGKFAAVGHDAKISYVDLQRGEVVKALDVSVDVFDVVLAGNGWVYASPRVDQWVKLHAVEIATNNETENEGNQIRAATIYKLHPDGRSLYGADQGLSPSDIEKIDISQGTAAYAYDSPYHGDYEMCGNLWMSEDGRRIFTACGNVFRASSDRATDMTYNGSLSRLPYIRHAVHSSAAGRVLAIPGKRPFGLEEGGLAENQLAVFGYDTLNTEEIVPLPDFMVNNSSFMAQGRFVFVNSTGTQYYVIVQADETSGLLKDFGLVIGEF